MKPSCSCCRDKNRWKIIANDPDMSKKTENENNTLRSV
ncbi:hypothetical protein GYO_2730 [Bacillus spizizenii TU-B-10]|uniref:Uncharacterized protein n=1 Tax=Bacillus spizizenii (strain DSM 15029 / JCM 12233 / NBRC 101239 / NRRL B-23049 / TU-B-10) TaxID=1052585 RepID=G4NQ93_BACS4|nr:hypothetical protein GYO_2730 [Bacillus spizizenii TU-B-10]